MLPNLNEVFLLKEDISSQFRTDFGTVSKEAEKCEEDCDAMHSVMHRKTISRSKGYGNRKICMSCLAVATNLVLIPVEFPLIFLLLLKLN